MKALITGGCGFIGSHLADMLIENGHSVAIVDNLSTGKRENANPKAAFYQMDILDPDLASVFHREKPNIVYHHAAQIDIQTSIQKPVVDAQINILGSLQVLNCVRDFQVNKLVYASSAALYGNPKYLPVDEEHPCQPISFYGISKLTPEYYIRVFAELYGFAYTILRYANVYGIRQDPKGEGGVVSIFTNKLLTASSPTIYGNGEQTRDFIYVKDVALANMMAMDKGNNQILNVSNNCPVTINALYSVMASCVQHASPPIYVMARPGDILHSTLDNAKIKEALGFAPRYSLEQGVRETIDYYASGTV